MAFRISGLRPSFLLSLRLPGLLAHLVFLVLQRSGSLIIYWLSGSLLLGLSGFPARWDYGSMAPLLSLWLKDI